MDDEQLGRLMQILDELGWSVAYISKSKDDDGDLSMVDGVVIGTTEYIEELLGPDEKDKGIPTPVADA